MMLNILLFMLGIVVIAAIELLVCVSGCSRKAGNLDHLSVRRSDR